MTHLKEIQLIFQILLILSKIFHLEPVNVLRLVFLTIFTYFVLTCFKTRFDRFVENTKYNTAMLITISCCSSLRWAYFGLNHWDKRNKNRLGWAVPSSGYLAFMWFCLYVRWSSCAIVILLYSPELVYLSVGRPMRMSSCKIVFLSACLPFTASSSNVLLISEILPVGWPSCWFSFWQIVFLLGRLPFRLTTFKIVFL